MNDYLDHFFGSDFLVFVKLSNLFQLTGATVLAGSHGSHHMTLDETVGALTWGYYYQGPSFEN